MPFSEYDQCTAKVSAPPRAHTRWHSVDVVPARATPPRAILSTIRQGRRSLNISRSSEDDHTMLRCSPQIVAAVAKVFADHVRSVLCSQLSLLTKVGRLAVSRHTKDLAQITTSYSATLTRHNDKFPFGQISTRLSKLSLCTSIRSAVGRRIRRRR